MNHLMRCIQISLVERLTDIIGKVKKEIIHKTNQPVTFKTSLSTQVEALMKGSCGEFMKRFLIPFVLGGGKYQGMKISLGIY